jgi:hypothetical protein
MATKDTQTSTAPTAPGPKVVEALASPMFARFVAAALQEAREALDLVYRRPVTEDGPLVGLTPTQTMTLDVIDSLGAQLVTATTPTPAGGAS